MDWRIVAVVVLVIGSGCNVAPFGSGSTSTPEESVTPVPIDATTVSTASDTPTGQFYEDGEVKVEALQAAHEAALENKSYTWVFTDLRTHPGRKFNDTRFVRRVSVEGNTFLVRQTGFGFGTDTLYVTDGIGYRRTGRGANASVRRVPDPPAVNELAFTIQALERYLTGLEFERRVVERAGQRFIRLYTPPGRPPSPLKPDPMSGRRVWNYTATAYIRPSGLVRTLVVSYWQQSTRETEHVSFRLDYRSVGETNVSRPAWIPQRDSRNSTTIPIRTFVLKH